MIVRTGNLLEEPESHGGRKKNLDANIKVPVLQNRQKDRDTPFMVSVGNFRWDRVGRVREVTS